MFSSDARADLGLADPGPGSRFTPPSSPRRLRWARPLTPRGCQASHWRRPPGHGCEGTRWLVSARPPCGVGRLAGAVSSEPAGGPGVRRGTDLLPAVSQEEGSEPERALLQDSPSAPGFAQRLREEPRVLSAGAVGATRGWSRATVSFIAHGAVSASKCRSRESPCPGPIAKR